jgi:hypothetical protein
VSSVALRAGEFLVSHLPHLPITERVVQPERLRAALEGRAVTVSDQSWRLEVYSVTDRDGRRWVQLALEGEPHYMLTLNLTMGAGAQRALNALASCLANPSEAGGIVNVA